MSSGFTNYNVHTQVGTREKFRIFQIKSFASINTSSFFFPIERNSLLSVFSLWLQLIRSTFRIILLTFIQFQMSICFNGLDVFKVSLLPMCCCFTLKFYPSVSKKKMRRKSFAVPIYLQLWERFSSNMYVQNQISCKTVSWICVCYTETVARNGLLIKKNIHHIKFANFYWITLYSVTRI